MPPSKFDRNDIHLSRDFKKKKKNCYKVLSFHLSLQKQSFDKCCTFFASIS